MFMSYSRNNRAFTLIELLVVISIISLLSTVVFAVFSTSRVQAQDAAKKETVHNVQQALELYRTKHGVYPPNFSDNLSTNVRTSPAIQGDAASGDAYTASMEVLVNDGDLAAVPKSDSGAGYGYYNAGDTATFFTQLTGGYGGVSNSAIFPKTLLTIGSYSTYSNYDELSLDSHGHLCKPGNPNTYRCYLVARGPYDGNMHDSYIYMPEFCYDSDWNEYPCPDGSPNFCANFDSGQDFYYCYWF